MTTQTVSRSMHDLGLAAWFGGTLANAVALNPAAAKADSASGTGAVANAGWDRWTPVNALAIGAHLAGSVGQVAGNQDRLAAQEGVGAMATAKTGLTVAALVLTARARRLGRIVSEHQDVPAGSGTDPVAATPPKVAKAQRKLRRLQWLIPTVTGALVVVSAYAGEQQRPAEVKRGVLARAAGGSR